MKNATRYASIEDRIIANSVISDRCFYESETGEVSACWDWLGKRVTSIRGNEYPLLTMRFGKKIRNVRVHRLVLEVFKGRELRKRQVAMHLCNNSICVNPAHLAGGTQRQNVRQTVADGRHRNQYT